MPVPGTPLRSSGKRLFTSTVMPPSGEPLEEGDDLYRTVVQLAARLCAAAQPGQVLVSNVVRELAAGKGFRFDDLGAASLEGFPGPVHRYALVPGGE